MTRKTIEVVYTKFDGRLHWHFTLARLGEDEHGVWLAGPPGTVLQRGAEPPKAELDGFVALVPANGTWAAFWNVSDDPEVYVDVTSHPVWSESSVTMLDLDLDVVRYRDGRIAVLDEDEFEEHQVQFGYPAEVIESAQATAGQLRDALTHRAEPFGARGTHWLELMSRNRV